jgi:ATP-dependent helicase/nuclease subunit A
VLDVKEEAESVLAEENLDAVRIMSIHKAKGLEFPIVILAGCQTGTDARRTLSAEALFDWSTGLTGIRVGRTWDLAGLYIAEKNRLRAEEEQKRVLYVAMTRAREHLIISCAPSARRTNGSFLAMLDETCQGKIAAAEESSNVAIGSGRAELRLVPESLGAPGGARNPEKADAKPNWQPYVETWDRRKEDYQSTLKTPVFVTPTLLKRQEEDIAEAARPKTRSSSTRTPPMIVGELAHRFLEAWDFAQDGEKLCNALGPFLDHWIPSDLRQHRETIQADLAEIFAGFFDSRIYAELARSQILGREVPLLMRWDGQIMEGVIDLIYEHDGLLYLADYKTDSIAREELVQATQRYERQAQVYSQAAQQSLERRVAAFKVIFLRLGESVRVPPDPYRALPLQLNLL